MNTVHDNSTTEAKRVRRLKKRKISGKGGGNKKQKIEGTKENCLTASGKGGPAAADGKTAEFQLEVLADSKLTIGTGTGGKGNGMAQQRGGGGEESSEEKRERERQQRVRWLRKAHGMFTWGEDVPDPVEDFDALGLPERLRENVRLFPQPTPVQMQALPVGLQQRDHLVTAPTGSGKTLAFVLPLIRTALLSQQSDREEKGKAKTSSTLSTIVLEPTKILAKQTLDNFVRFSAGLDLNCSYLGADLNIAPHCHILVSTPNRLLFALDNLSGSHSGQSTTARESPVPSDSAPLAANNGRSAAIGQLLSALRWLVVDECDRLFERTEGESSFRPQLERILRLCSGPATRRAFYSATLSPEVEQWCARHLSGRLTTICIGPRNCASESVLQQLLFVGWEQAKVSSVRDIVRRGFQPPALIFLQSKDRAKQLYVELTQNCPDISIGLISGELNEKECNSMVHRFREGAIWLLICTEMLGRGLDFPEVNLVVNFDLPTSIVSYIHRIGRTGRAGNIGKAITLFTEADLHGPIIRPIATVVHQAGFPVPAYLLHLQNSTRTERRELRRKAPKRRNLVVQWGRLKHKVRADGQPGISSREKQRRRGKGKRRTEEKKEKRERGNGDRAEDSEGKKMQSAGMKRSKRKRKGTDPRQRNEVVGKENEEKGREEDGPWQTVSNRRRGRPGKAAKGEGKGEEGAK